MGKLAIACLTLLFVCIPLSDGRRCPSCRSDQGSGCERLAETCVECGDFSCTKGEIKSNFTMIKGLGKCSFGNFSENVVKIGLFIEFCWAASYSVIKNAHNLRKRVLKSTFL